MPEISARARHSCARHRLRRLCQPPECCRASVPDANHSRPTFQSGAVGMQATWTSRLEAERAGANESNALQFISALRRYAIGERVGVKIGVITQTVPGTILFVRLRDAVFFTRGKVIPRIVPGDGEERPVGALQMLHQYVARSRVVCRAW